MPPPAPSAMLFDIVLFIKVSSPPITRTPPPSPPKLEDCARFPSIVLLVIVTMLLSINSPPPYWPAGVRPPVISKLFRLTSILLERFPTDNTRSLPLALIVTLLRFGLITTFS